MQERGCVVVFSKPAHPGKVKTRLVGEQLSAQQAAELHQAFLDDLIARLIGSGVDLRVAWALEPGEEPPDLGLPALRQKGEDLGERLHNALREVSESHPLVAAVGSDHPELPLERVHSAFSVLEEGADMVLGPAADGGYYLVAVRREALAPDLFADVPWSTSEVLATTIRRCAELGLRLELLPIGHDVDTPADLPRLGAYLAAHPAACPRTRELFERWALGGER